MLHSQARGRRSVSTCPVYGTSPRGMTVRITLNSQQVIRDPPDTYKYTAIRTRHEIPPGKSGRPPDGNYGDGLFSLI
ncbi:hypothetical protein L209DRAFT_759455 [Thermothelomyces heterothallicus CBS 203.75]